MHLWKFGAKICHFSRCDYSFHKRSFHGPLWYITALNCVWNHDFVQQEHCVTFSGKCPHISQKCRSHLQILGARRVTWTKVHSWRPTLLEWSVNLMAIWCLLPCASKLISQFYLFGGGGGICSNATGNIRRHSTNSNSPGGSGTRDLCTPTPDCITSWSLHTIQFSSLLPCAIQTTVSLF